MRHFEFVAAVERAERRLVEELGLTPLQLSPELAAAAASWNGRPARLLVRAWAGPEVRHARAVTIEGDGLEIGNLRPRGQEVA